MKLAKQAEAIAFGKLTKDRVQDSIQTLVEMKEKEISQVIQLLQSIKEAYDTNMSQIEAEIEKMGATNKLIKYGFMSIDSDIFEFNIKNSIDWQEVNKLLTSILSDNLLKRIKESNKLDAKNEFWELLNWTKKKSLKPSTVSKIIEDYKNIPPKICFEILSTKITNTDNKPFYVEDIRYVGLELNINSSDNQEITFHMKYINPDGELKFSSENSPEGYTFSNTIIINPETKEIDLGGWGNKKKCTYMVGEHKIEVYVDHYKIYTHTFQVDWSPNKKSELIRNIKILQNKLTKIEKFHLFRLPETKLRQVNEVQNKIKAAKNTLTNR
jgi:hypothetical protein